MWRLNGWLRSSWQSMVNLAQEPFLAFHRPQCPTLCRRSIRSGTEDQDQGGLKIAEDGGPQAPNLRLQGHPRDLSAQSLRTVTMPLRAAIVQSHGSRVRPFQTSQKVRLPSIQLHELRRLTLMHPILVRMFSGKCRDHTRLAPTHYDRLLDRVCRRLHSSFLIRFRIHQRCRLSPKRTPKSMQVFQPAQSLRSSPSHNLRSLPWQAPLLTPC